MKKEGRAHSDPELTGAESGMYTTRNSAAVVAQDTSGVWRSSGAMPDRGRAVEGPPVPSLQRTRHDHWDTWFPVLAYLGILASLWGLPAFLSSDFNLYIAVEILILAIAVVGVNIVLGYAGIISFGHGGFLTVGAYASALTMMRLEMSFAVAFAMAVVLSAGCGLLVGLIGRRLHSYLWLLLTFGFAQVVLIVSLNWNITGGSQGLVGVPPPSIGPLSFETTEEFYRLALVALVVCVYVADRLKRSRTGRALIALSQSETVAASSGINVPYHKVLALTISGAYLGVAGSLYAPFISYIDPRTFSTDTTVLLWLMVVLGGAGSSFSPILTLAGFQILIESLRDFGEYWIFIFGVAIIVVTIVAPAGLAGVASSGYRRVRLWLIRIAVRVRGERRSTIERRDRQDGG